MTAASPVATALTRHTGIELPVIGGAMYPCSNPELVAAVSEAGGIGIVQPISLTYVHGWGFRDGLKFIRTCTAKPIGFNALIERSSRRYHERMVEWVNIALEEGVRFFVTSLGNPRWVVDRVTPIGGVVYHDVTERRWALKGRDAGVHGLIAVNQQAGGHAGPKDPRALLEELADLDLPVVCAGGIGTATDFVQAMQLGYAGVQMGTRFIATTECRASPAYKAAIVSASEDDIALSERITGVPVSVIRTPYIDRMGLKAGPFARWMLRGHRRKRWMRTLYALRSLWQLKRSSLDETGKKEYWQAGKSVAGVSKIEPVADILDRFRHALNTTDHSLP